jgi:hypothetical protein
MAHNDWVGDSSAVQTTPPSEIHLAAPVQDVHKMIADHIALTTLASHKVFSEHVLTGSGESDSAQHSRSNDLVLHSRSRLPHETLTLFNDIAE